MPGISTPEDLPSDLPGKYSKGGPFDFRNTVETPTPYSEEGYQAARSNDPFTFN